MPLVAATASSAKRRGRGQIPARQRGLGRVGNPDRRHLGLDTEMGQARRDCIVGRGNVARGKSRDSQPRVGEAWENPRSTSLTALGISRGSSRTRSHWSGLFANNHTALPMAQIVVSRLGPM